MRRTDYIASDVHLGAVPRETETAFIAFLEHAGAHARSLLLVGDLFDFWFEYGPVVPGRHFRVLAALRDLVDAGLPVTLMGGNHDAWGGRFLREEVGVAFHPDPVYLELGGRRALVAHGDGVGRGDLKYRALKAVLRSRAAILAFRLLHPELGVRLARAVSSTEHKADGDDAARGRAAYIAEWARSRLREEPELGLVVCGHAHLPAVEEFEPGRYYVNAGDWLRHDSYITVSPGEAPALHRWERQAARS
ncbi:MAG TPA: UDP-2,3-diacylglucosamine diphosphatase [Longimicrobiales bacterium]